MSSMAADFVVSKVNAESPMSNGRMKPPILISAATVGKASVSGMFSVSMLRALAASFKGLASIAAAPAFTPRPKCAPGMRLPIQASA